MVLAPQRLDSQKLGRLGECSVEACCYQIQRFNLQVTVVRTTVGVQTVHIGPLEIRLLSRR